MNVVPDQTIILGLHIFLDQKSLSWMGQKILMILPPPFPISPCFDLNSSLEVVWMFSESYSLFFVSFSFCFFSICLFVVVNLQ